MTKDPRDWTRTPGTGPYARPERERRFLVATAPTPTIAVRLITDHYVSGTTLRLRRVQVGVESVHKLTQKVRPVADDPAEVSITNTYLTSVEYALLLASLPGQTLVKSRSVHQGTTLAFVVDTFHGALAGLVLAEVEVRDLEDPLDLPDWIGTEVTRDERLSGASLASADADRIRQLLAVCTGKGKDE